MEREPSYLIPINFSLTERAKNWIRDVAEKCRAEKKIDPVPAISWATGLKEPEGEWQEISGPCLGVFDRPQLPADAIQNLDGIELVFNVPAEQVLLFEDRVIDFSEERGIHFAD